MNRKYINRQLKLKKLGFEIDEELQQMIEKFNDIILENLKKEYKEYGGYYNNKGYMYSKNNIDLLFYDLKNEAFWVNYKYIWSKFKTIFWT